MDKIWWFGVAVLVVAGVALVTMIVQYRKEQINMDDRSYNFDDEDWPDYSKEDEVYDCCDHCPGAAGEIPEGHPRNNHSLPCDVIVNGHMCQGY